jgi:hypothetical protein
MKKQTAVQWLVEELTKQNMFMNLFAKEIEQALAMEKEQMIVFAEYVERYPNKNRNHLGQMLHAKSKYDEANRTVDLLEQYYNETYGK